MKRRLLAGSAAALLAAGTVLAVFCYNTWSWCCGRCTLGTFLTLGPFGGALLGITLLAGLFLAFLKLHRPRTTASCRCGATPSSDWRFCPACGVPLGRSRASDGDSRLH